MYILLLALLMFTRLDGHAVWVNPATVTSVQGAGQLGYPTGTLLSAGSSIIVRENVTEVVRKLQLDNAGK